MNICLDSARRSVESRSRVGAAGKLCLPTVLCFLLTHGTAYSQKATLTLSSGAGAAGETVSLDLSLDAEKTVRPAGLQWTLRYSPRDFTAASVAAGPAVTAAQKSLSCAGEQGRTVCLVTGKSRTAISPGRVATVTLTIADTPENDVLRVDLTQAAGTTQSGSRIPVSGSKGIVRIPLAEPLDAPEPSQADPSRRARPGTRVLLPGSQAWKPPPRPEPTTPAEPEPAGQAPEVSATPVEADSEQPREGTLFWIGKLKKNEVVVIEGREANWGFADGQFLPGVPVEVKVFSPAISISEQPNPQNGWKRVAFRCLRSTTGSITVNIEWRLLR